MKNLLLLIFVISFVPGCFSQDVSFLKGIVVNDSISIENITVTNKNLKLSTGTNELGVFEIPVRLGDSVSVSAIHINNVSLFINQEILDKKGIEVLVTNKINNMDAVVLNNILSKSALDFSAAYKPSSKPDLESMRRMEITRMANTDPTAIFGAGGGGVGSGAFNLTKPLFMLIGKLKKNSLSKREEQKRKNSFKRDFINEFNESFFTEELKIPGLKIDEFLSYCNKKQSLYEMYSKNEKLELIDFLIKQSKNYKAKLNME